MPFLRLIKCETVWGGATNGIGIGRFDLLFVNVVVSIGVLFLFLNL